MPKGFGLFLVGGLHSIESSSMAFRDHGSHVVVGFAVWSVEPHFPFLGS